jgi:hypothetical protein
MQWLKLFNNEIDVVYSDELQQWKISLTKDNSDIELSIYFNNESNDILDAIVIWKSKNFFYRWRKDMEQIVSNDEFVHLDVFSDFIEKAESILRKDDTFDKRILMEFECSSEEYKQIKMAADYEKISVDEFVENAMLYALKRLER